jgi:hypothetical protein
MMEQGPDSRLFFRQHLLLLDDDLRAAIAEAAGLSQAISTVPLSRLAEAMRGAVGFVDRLQGLSARVEERLVLLQVAVNRDISRWFRINDEQTADVDVDVTPLQYMGLAFWQKMLLLATGLRIDLEFIAMVADDLAIRVANALNTSVDYPVILPNLRQVMLLMVSGFQIALGNIRQQIDKVANDFRGVDLRTALLLDTDLTGLRWDQSTLWPEEMRNRIRRISEEEFPGIWIVRSERHGEAVEQIPVRG